MLSKLQGNAYVQTLGVFLDYFPFDFEKWSEYIDLTSPETYQVALKRNPKSYELWIKYLDYVRTTPIYKDTPKYRRQVERAILQVGADTRVTSLYLEYYQMLSENYQWEFYKKIFTRALLNLEHIHQRFLKWFSSLS